MNTITTVTPNVPADTPEVSSGVYGPTVSKSASFTGLQMKVDVTSAFKAYASTTTSPYMLARVSSNTQIAVNISTGFIKITRPCLSPPAAFRRLINFLSL
jgi:hypothetical protein